MKRLVILLALFVAYVGTAQAQVELRRQKNTATRVVVPIRNASDGTLITGASGLDTECDTFANGADPDGFADISDEAAEIGSTGVYQYTLSSGETNSDFIVCQTKSSSTNAMTAIVLINTIHGTVLTGSDGALDADTIPNDAYAARGTAQAATGTTIQLASAETFGDDELNDTTEVIITSASTGAGQSRCIKDYVGSTDTATVDTWATTPTGTIKYDLRSNSNCIGNVKKWNGTAVASPDTAGYPVVTIKNGTGSGEITTTSGLALSLVGSVGSGVITNAAFAAGAIDASAIAANAIGASEIADNAIDAGAIASDAITAAKLATNSITSDELAASALAEFITTDTGTTSSSAVEGSVAKETADLGGGGGGSCPTVEDIRDGLIASDANLSSQDCHSGSYCAAQAEKTREGVDDLLQGTPGDDYIATNSPLRFGGVDYTDANFGFGAGFNTFFFSENGQPSGCDADNCRITGLLGSNTSDLDIGLVTETYTGGGGCGTLHQTVIVPRGLLGDTCSAFATNLNNALSGGGGGGCTLTGITCENFKQSYFTANAMADFTWNGLTGFENGGTVTVVSGKTSPATVAYDPQPPTLANVNVQQWSDAVVATPNTGGVPLVEADELGTQAKADVNAEVVDVMSTDTHAELSALPGSSPTLKQMLQYVYQFFRFKKDSTATEETIYKDDGTTELGASALSDDGTTFTRGEMSTP